MSWSPAVGFEVFGALVSSRGPAGYSPGQVAFKSPVVPPSGPRGCPSAPSLPVGPAWPYAVPHPLKG